jgi:hypothetical protein
MQILTLYCARAEMQFYQIFVYDNDEKAKAQGQPGMSAVQRRVLLEEWLDNLRVRKTCQTRAAHEGLKLFGIDQRTDKYSNTAYYKKRIKLFGDIVWLWMGAKRIQPLDFLLDNLLMPVPYKAGADYSNKCSRYHPKIGTESYPSDDNINTCMKSATRQTCPPETQFQCLCESATADIDGGLPGMNQTKSCFGNPEEKRFDHPVPTSALGDCAMWDENFGKCVDLAMNPKFAVKRDDFDLMAHNFLTYVQSSLVYEVNTRVALQEDSTARCPYGTMTPTDGSAIIDKCWKRTRVTYLQESIEMAAARVNPINLNASKISFDKSAFDPEDEETFRPVFFARAGSMVLITFDLRHLPSDITYGVDYTINVYANDTLDPLYNESMECRKLLRPLADFTALPADVSPRQAAFAYTALNAWAMGCRQLIHAKAFDPAFYASSKAPARKGPPPYGFFTLMYHPIIDTEWRLEVAILNGLYLPDRLMFVRSAIVEYIEPTRGELGTPKFFFAIIEADSSLELPTNMPLSYNPYDQQGYFCGGAESDDCKPKAFLNYLPIVGELDYKLSNDMSLEAEYAQGNGLYTYAPKSIYYIPNQKYYALSYLPFFSNCRGFGRTIPLWAAVEQMDNCEWSENPTAIGMLDFGKMSTGDMCRAAVVECLLDEVPNVRRPNRRWFESLAGDVLFLMTAQAYDGQYMLEISSSRSTFEASDLVPVSHERPEVSAKDAGASELPKGVVFLLQYWQMTAKEKKISAWFCLPGAAGAGDACANERGGKMELHPDGLVLSNVPL